MAQRAKSSPDCDSREELLARWTGRYREQRGFGEAAVPGLRPSLGEPLVQLQAYL